MRQRLGLALIGTILLVAATQAQTVTGVSGTIADGSSITVTGTDFGTKATAAPDRWDDFDGGTNTNTLGDGWDFTGSAPNPTYSNVITRTGSSLSARANFENDLWASNFGRDATSFTNIYLDFWYYYDLDAANRSRNHKIFRFHANTDSSPNLYYNIYCGDVGHFSQDGVGIGNWHVWYDPGGWSYFSETWRHIQLWIQQSSAGGSDGVAHMWLDGVQIINENAFTTRQTGQPLWDAVWLGNYLAHDSDGTCDAPANAYTYFDDVYHDSTRARVEIGDNSVYTSTGVREIQIPSAWSDTSLTVTLNQGAFASLDQQWLFVTDSNGNTSGGYQLGVDDPRPPGPSDQPVRLRVDAQPGDRLHWDNYVSTAGPVEWFEVSEDGASPANLGLQLSTMPFIAVGLIVLGWAACNVGGCTAVKEIEVDVQPPLPDPPSEPQDSDFTVGP